MNVDTIVNVSATIGKHYIINVRLIIQQRDNAFENLAHMMSPNVSFEGTVALVYLLIVGLDAAKNNEDMGLTALLEQVRLLSYKGIWNIRRCSNKEKWRKCRRLEKKNEVVIHFLVRF